MYLTLRTKEIQETIESYVRLSHAMTTNNTFGLTAPEQILDMQALSRLIISLLHLVVMKILLDFLSGFNISPPGLLQNSMEMKKLAYTDCQFDKGFCWYYGCPSYQ